ncbi:MULTISPECIES: DivIVA domain-containing protein [unclassified Microbacterium]|uniref:DivIVA domain-containing protein n=1 Tax=unclassified Microbacterium TaxID=2609290 RepID=UPI000CFB2837|nr:MULTISPECIES: DivIVA domain-containing protein [unclassified Microbacterium]PQZ61140.1 MFS transporter permease [Microbacterium sp. MYb43]PQZ82351.1 MFS transporter permease [Microbacterium sp. MYb40]PRB23949.1 MFS transporter permease [Microbacterium sp. MYb54]PRB30780.1 MFS transporter permease [Microbacterium sp. MYb50]PRB70798.1 MFS transporter permease [Microbacterium sp. MYb24]
MTENQLDEQTAQAPAAFALTSGRVRGYHRAAVDTFLASARRAFEAGGDELSADDVRTASFPLVKGGYVVADVDAALGRVEDAFAARERERVVRAQGAGVWVEQARSDAQTILDHLARPRRHRFARTGVLTFGYRIDEVDHVSTRIVRYLRDGDALTVEQLRSAAFRMQRGGYREEQVDALLDATIDVILAVR